MSFTLYVIGFVFTPYQASDNAALLHRRRLIFKGNKSGYTQ